MGWSETKPWVKREVLVVILIFLAFAALITVLIMFNKPSGPVCNEPYILVGTECCLDQDANAICDADEEPEPEPEEITGAFAAETEEIEEIEGADAPLFEIHVKLNGEVRDKAELSYSGITPMPGLTLSIRNLDIDDIRCDVDPTYNGELVTNRISRNVRVKTYDPENINIHGVTSEYGDNYKAEFEVTCRFEDSDVTATEEVYFTANFT